MRSTLNRDKEKSVTINGRITLGPKLVYGIKFRNFPDSNMISESNLDSFVENHPLILIYSLQQI